MSETEAKLVGLEARLGAWRGTEPGWKLLGKVRELLERCQILAELGQHAATRAISDLLIEASVAERIVMGAPTCEHHPLAVAARISSAPLCRACYDRHVATAAPPRRAR